MPQNYKIGPLNIMSSRQRCLQTASTQRTCFTSGLSMPTSETVLLATLHSIKFLLYFTISHCIFQKLACNLVAAQASALSPSMQVTASCDFRSSTRSPSLSKLKSLMLLRVSTQLYKDFLVATIINEVPIGILPHNTTSTWVINRLTQPDFFCTSFVSSISDRKPKRYGTTRSIKTGNN